jgi:hypothetical protein
MPSLQRYDPFKDDAAEFHRSSRPCCRYFCHCFMRNRLSCSLTYCVGIFSSICNYIGIKKSCAVFTKLVLICTPRVRFPAGAGIFLFDIASDSGAHLISSAVGTEGLSRGVKRILVPAQILNTTVSEVWRVNGICVQNIQCPKILEPMGMLFIIYIICSICSPRHSAHFPNRFTAFVRILLNTLGSTVA